MKTPLKALSLVGGKQTYHLPEHTYRQLKTVPIRFVCATEM